MKSLEDISHLGSKEIFRDQKLNELQTANMRLDATVDSIESMQRMITSKSLKRQLKGAEFKEKMDAYVESALEYASTGSDLVKRIMEEDGPSSKRYKTIFEAMTRNAELMTKLTKLIDSHFDPRTRAAEMPYNLGDKPMTVESIVGSSEDDIKGILGG